MVMMIHLWTAIWKITTTQKLLPVWRLLLLLVCSVVFVFLEPVGIEAMMMIIMLMPTKVCNIYEVITTISALGRNVCRYQKDNQKPTSWRRSDNRIAKRKRAKGQTMVYMYNTTQKTTYRATRTPQKNGSKIMYSRVINCICLQVETSCAWFNF